MTIYTVLAPRARAGSAEPDRFVFVKEGFCWPAFYMTIPWLIWRGMWLSLVAYVLVVAAVFAFAGGAPPPVAWTILVLFGALVGLEANNLRRWTLERRGYRFLGVAAGDRKTEAEYRFFVAWASGPATLNTHLPSDHNSQSPDTSTPTGAREIDTVFHNSAAPPSASRCT
jgi:hypothetical protein